MLFFIIENNLSMRVVSSQSFKKFLYAPCHNRAIMAKKHLPKLFEKFIKALQDALKNQIIHLGFDLWSSLNNISYLISTAHWIDEDWELQQAG